MLQNTASSGVRERGERGVEAGPGILNHVVQYYRWIARTQGGGRARAALPAVPQAQIGVIYGSRREWEDPGGLGTAPVHPPERAARLGAIGVSVDQRRIVVEATLAARTTTRQIVRIRQFDLCEWTLRRGCGRHHRLVTTRLWHVTSNGWVTKIIDIGLLDGYKSGVATGVSNDGRRVVGFCGRVGPSGDYEYDAFLWEPGKGLRSLRKLVRQPGAPVLVGWKYLAATGISSDGRYVCGYGLEMTATGERAWVAYVN